VQRVLEPQVADVRNGRDAASANAISSILQLTPQCVASRAIENGSPM
jgi:hypothetical protein